MSVYDASRLPHLADEMRLIGRALKEGAPILGVCLGSQLLAASLGARVVPSGRKEIGWHEVRLAAAAREDTLWDKVGNSFQGFHWHGDVFDLPDRALPLASSAMTPLQAFRWGSNAYGLLFHLEVGPVQVRDMTHSFRDELASAGIPEGPILDGIERHAPSLQRIGAQVFGRWARIVDPQLKASG
jgi:GMP synthase (glutamine-hydrolysing)